MAHRSEQSKEPIQQHDLAARPWSKVAVDLCDLDRRTLLVIEWFSKRTGTSFQNGARSKNTEKKLGRERRRVVLKTDLAVVSTNRPRYICS